MALLHHICRYHLVLLGLTSKGWIWTRKRTMFFLWAHRTVGSNTCCSPLPSPAPCMMVCWLRSKQYHARVWSFLFRFEVGGHDAESALLQERETRLWLKTWGFFMSLVSSRLRVKWRSTLKRMATSLWGEQRALHRDGEVKQAEHPSLADRSPPPNSRARE